MAALIAAATPGLLDAARAETPAVTLRVIEDEAEPSEDAASRWAPSLPGLAPLPKVSQETPSSPAKTRSAARSPASAGDELWILNSRGLGDACSSANVSGGLQCLCERNLRDGVDDWQSLTWAETVAALGDVRPTVIFVHGNRTQRGEDRSQGLAVFRAVRSALSPETSCRLIVWSWPADPIRGPLRDYKLKAARTVPAAWRLAWVVDRLPASTPLTIVGYSYGARVTTGALHLLAGGRLQGLSLEPRRATPRQPVTAILVAAAVNADWLRPAGPHGRSLTQVDRLTLLTNRLDPVMRFYHLSSEGSGVAALGYEGATGLARGSTLAGRVQQVDVTSAVGRHHALEAYLAAGDAVLHTLRQAAPALVPHRTDGLASIR